jgi:hypothetical protein
MFSTGHGGLAGSSLISVWYVIVDISGEYLALGGRGWVKNLNQAEVYTSLGNA